jgi:hypothetical protein
MARALAATRPARSVPPALPRAPVLPRKRAAAATDGKGAERN